MHGVGVKIKGIPVTVQGVFRDESTRTLVSRGWTTGKFFNARRHCVSVPTKTSLLAGSTAAMSAVGSVALSTAAGMAASKSRYLSGAGTMVTLLVSAVMSNVGLSPASSPVYEMCWTKFLPLSLALVLLAPQKEENHRGLVSGQRPERSSLLGGGEDKTTKEMIGVVGVPFAIGSIGSVVGCIVSFIVCLLGANNPNRVHSRILHGRKHFFWNPGHLLLLPAEAAVGAGCLCASYIGGSVNFFATARIIASDVKFPNGDDGAVGMLGSLFGSSASDLLVMALYFSTVTASLSSALLRSWFPGREEDSCEAEVAGSSDMENTSLLSEERMRGDFQDKHVSNRCNGLGFRMVVAVSALALAWPIVEISDALESRSFSVPTPGIGCACIALLGTFVQRVLKTVPQMNMTTSISDRLLEDIQAVLSLMSDVCFYMLFAAIGSTVNLGETIRQGGWHSASGFIFAGLALAIHIAMILGGSLVVQQFVPRIRLAVDEIMVASNALIGGPVTAAALAAGMSTAGLRNSSRRRALIKAAVFWGVIGYAIATCIGVALTRFLLSFVTPLPL